MPVKYKSEEERLLAKKISRKKANDKYFTSTKFKTNQQNKILPKQTLNRKTNPKYLLLNTYYNMNNRVKGKVKPHLYKGLAILPYEEFYNWAINNKEFLKLYNEWQISKHQLKFMPSINRIDTRKGYILSNMEWLTHSKNSSLGAIARHHGGFIR